MEIATRQQWELVVQVVHLTPMAALAAHLRFLVFPLWVETGVTQQPMRITLPVVLAVPEMVMVETAVNVLVVLLVTAEMGLPDLYPDIAHLRLLLYTVAVAAAVNPITQIILTDLALVLAVTLHLVPAPMETVVAAGVQRQFTVYLAAKAVRDVSLSEFISRRTCQRNTHLAAHL